MVVNSSFQTAKLVNAQHEFSCVNIKMLLAVVDMQHSLDVLIMAVNRAADHLCGFFLYDFLCHSTALLSRIFIFVQLLPRLTLLEFR